MSADAMKTIFTDFAALLETRVGHDVRTTEDSVRYTLFAAMLRNKVEPHEVVQEFPHPVLGGDNKRVDTWMPDFHGKAVAIEFKYDVSRGATLNETQRGGAVFEDLRRLQLLSDHAVCYFVYVTTKEMDRYFRNQHGELYGLVQAASVEIRESYFADKPKTFMDQVGGLFEATVTGVVNQRISDHNLRVYNVAKASGGASRSVRRTG